MAATVVGAPMSGSRRAAAVAVAVAAVVVPLSLALMMSNGAAAGEVAANARSLHWSKTMLGSAAVSRAANAQAVVFAVDHELGVASDSALRDSVAGPILADMDAPDPDR